MINLVVRYLDTMHTLCTRQQHNLRMPKTATCAGVHVNSRTRKGLTALALAAQNGHTEVVKLLLQRKANAGVTNQKGQTPADMAKTDEVRVCVCVCVCKCVSVCLCVLVCCCVCALAMRKTDTGLQPPCE